MANLTWLINRLKAMSRKEVMWRLQQISLQKSERKRHKAKQESIVSAIYNPTLLNLSLDANKLGLNLENNDFSLNSSISLFEIFPYETYRKDWHAGFQTDKKWPLEFSYDLEYKQRDEIGDARTNWEMNRHFQFGILAKDYYASGNKKYLEEFIELFDDWNSSNPFLHGISWTSVMEVAIRISSWTYSYCFLAKSDEVPETVLEQLRIGILNMTEYVANHYSRFSSANNHLIVEAYAIGLSGILFGYKDWLDTAVSILSHQIVEQNYRDGVNKELSIHYQTFLMDAVGLLIHVMQFNHIAVPKLWVDMLDKMSQYISDCIGSHGEVIVFGDNDEGKILDLTGHGLNHYKYVLDLMGCILDKRYTEFDEICENICWLYSKEEIDKFKKKTLYKNVSSICYKEGGNSILRSNNGNVLIGIDHAALGFASIAAHGHADALSFQMFVNGIPVFVDPGTYIYHIKLEDRNYFRRTVNHNTIAVNGTDQSEMLGAFLWGRKAKTKLLKCELLGLKDVIKANHDGYSPIVHTRTFEFDRESHLCVSDLLEGREFEWSSTFVLNSSVNDVDISGNDINFSVNGVRILMRVSVVEDVATEISVVSVEVSNTYGTKVSGKAVMLKGRGKENISIKTDIFINR